MLLSQLWSLIYYLENFHIVTHLIQEIFWLFFFWFSILILYFHSRRVFLGLQKVALTFLDIWLAILWKVCDFIIRVIQQFIVCVKWSFDFFSFRQYPFAVYFWIFGINHLRLLMIILNLHWIVNTFSQLSCFIFLIWRLRKLIEKFFTHTDKIVIFEIKDNFDLCKVFDRSILENIDFPLPVLKTIEEWACILSVPLTLHLPKWQIGLI